MNNAPAAIRDVFLADDNQADCLAFEKAILQVGPHIKLTTVTNGDELMQLLAHYVPDVLFLDLEMPVRNGIQCLQAIRENKALDGLPVVVFTATDRPNNIQVAYGFGANLFFTKPKDPSRLSASLQHILSMDWSDPEMITQQYFRNNMYQPYTLNAS